MEKKKDYLALTLQHFECFLQLTRCGTMSAAAEVLHISQPLFSQKIAQLEAVIGTELFSRTKRTLELNAAGSEFLSQCESFMDNIDSVITAIRTDHAQPDQARLRFALNDGHAPFHPDLFVQQLQQTFPSAKIELSVGGRLAISEKLLNEELDFICIVDADELRENKKIFYRKITNLPIACLVSEKSPLARSGSLNWEDLNGCVCYWPISLRKSKFTRDIQSQLREHQVSLTWEWCDSDYYTCRRYLFAGNHLTFTLSPVVEDPTLKRCPLGGLKYPLIVAWNKKSNKQLETYIDKVVSLADLYLH